MGLQNKKDDPSLSMLTLDIVKEVLSQPDNLPAIANYLTLTLRELSGAHTVFLLQYCPTIVKNEYCVISVNPERRRHLAESLEDLIPKIINLDEMKLYCSGKQRKAVESILGKLGYNLSLIIPLRLGKVHVGSILVLGLPSEHHIASIMEVLNSLSSTITLVLRNSLLLEERENIIKRLKLAEEELQKTIEELDEHVEERTVQLSRTIKQLKQEIKERKLAEKALQESEKQLKSLSSQLLTFQEKERKRIAQELHDSVGQTLVALKYSVEKILNRINGKKVGEGAQSLEDFIPKIQVALEEVDKIGKGLRPSLLDDLGIIATFSWFCREFETVYTNIHIEKEITLQEDEVPDSIKLIMYRILQESLNNITKHSGADLVCISLMKKDHTLELVIKDNGRGFNLERILSPEHKKSRLGLISMIKRTELSGGSLVIKSNKESGTIIRALWQCQEQQRSKEVPTNKRKGKS